MVIVNGLFQWVMLRMFLGRGWSFVAKLSDEKAILKIS